jgi:hypothetical protein
MRRARVSGFLAVCNRHAIEYRFVPDISPAMLPSSPRPGRKEFGSV